MSHGDTEEGGGFPCAGSPPMPIRWRNPCSHSESYEGCRVMFPSYLLSHQEGLAGPLEACTMYPTRESAFGPLVIEKVNPEGMRHEKADLPFLYHSGPSAMVKSVLGRGKKIKTWPSLRKFFFTWSKFAGNLSNVLKDGYQLGKGLRTVQRLKEKQTILYIKLSLSWSSSSNWGYTRLPLEFLFYFLNVYLEK